MIFDPCYPQRGSTEADMEGTVVLKSDMTAMLIPCPDRTFRALILNTGRTALFFYLAVIRIFAAPVRFSRIFGRGLWFGGGSMLTVFLAGGAAGWVMALHIHQTLGRAPAGESLGAAAALFMVREIGPVFTAVLATALIGTTLAAEIAGMRISEHFEALETMGIDPIRFVVSPKLAGALIGLPLLSILFVLAGIVSAGLVGGVFCGVSPDLFFSGLRSGLRMSDMAIGLVKAAVFGAVFTSVCCYQGYTVPLRPAPGTTGGKVSTTTAVAHSCVLILFADALLTLLLI
jgi:phospholipid/cholesterol/gamma-HCH transport system permease protein